MEGLRHPEALGKGLKQKMLAMGAGLVLSTSACAQVNNGGAITTQELQQNAYTYPSDLVANANHTQLANYAWRLFIASMQLTTATKNDGAGRETPSSTTNFISTGKSTQFKNPLVFEGLYHRTEAYPFYTQGNKPASPIDQAPIYYTYFTETDKNGNEEEIAFTVKGQNYVNLDETNQIGQNMLYFRQSRDPDFPVLYMAKVNAAEVGYVWDKTTKPSADYSFVFPNGVLEVKTAWRRVKDINNSDLSTYHQAQGTYYVENENGGDPLIVTDNFALIAIHIIQKTANYQSFIFSSFEHVDATTRDNSGKIIDPAYLLSYDCLAYDYTPPPNTTITQSICQSRSGPGPQATATGAYDANLPGLSGGVNLQTTYSLPDAGTAPANYVTVVQPRTITSEVNDVNNQVTGLIKSLDQKNIWANYRLKGVQGDPSSNETILDYYLANIVVESSQPGVQLFRGGVEGPTSDGVFTNNRNNGALAANISLNLQEGQPVPAATYTMGGCQGCHGRAQQEGRDFSFLASGVAGAGKEVDTVPPSDWTDAQKAAHNAEMIESSNYDITK